MQRLRVRAAALDLAVYRRIRRLAGDPAATTRVRRFSTLGEHAGCWVALGLLGAAGDPGQRGRWLRATGTVLAAHAISTSIKLMVGRRRPAVVDLPHLMATPTGLSFPSSHATSSFAAAQAFRGLLPRAPLFAVAVAMGLSRLYLGVHYPSDVAAGAALGTVLGGAAR